MENFPIKFEKSLEYENFLTRMYVDGFLGKFPVDNCRAIKEYIKEIKGQDGGVTMGDLVDLACMVVMGSDELDGGDLPKIIVSIDKACTQKISTTVDGLMFCQRILDDYNKERLQLIQ